MIPDTMHTSSAMNKHSLNYHTRLHDWYHQHNILQDKQRSHVSGSLPTPRTEGIQNLTNDKLHFIIDWCSDVNSSFFNAASNESKSTIVSSDQECSSAHKGRTKSTNPQQASSSEVFKLADRRGEKPQPVPKRGTIKSWGYYKSPNVISTGQNKGYPPVPRKIAKTIKSDSHLDLCIRNSKPTDKKDIDSIKVTQDSLNLDGNKQIVKQNGSLLSGRIVNSSEDLTLRSGIGLKRNYRLASVTNKTRYHGNRSYIVAKGADEGHDQTAQKPIINSAKRSDSVLFGELRNSNNKHDKEKDFEKANQSAVANMRSIQVKGGSNSGGEQSVLSTSSTTCESICSDDDNQVLASATNCQTRIDSSVLQTVRNSENKTKLNAITEYGEEKMSEINISNEHSLDEKVIITPNKSVKTKLRTEEVNVDYNIDSYNTRSNQREQRDSSTDSGSSILNQRQLRPNITENGDSCRESKPLKPDKRNIKGREETKTKDDLSEDSTLTLGNDSDKFYSENDNKENKRQNGSPEQAQSKSTSSSHTRENGRASLCVLEEPIISYMSLSNNLLNVLSIDDCKISMRYTLKKTNARVIPEGQDSTQIQMAFINPKNSHLKFDNKYQNIIDKGKATRKKGDSSALPRTSSYKVAGIQKRCTLVFPTKNRTNSQVKQPKSVMIEKYVLDLMQHGTVKQQSGFPEFKKWQKAAGVNYDQEGPCYRRLRAKLRAHMGEMLRSRCAKQLARYKLVADDLVTTSLM